MCVFPEVYYCHVAPFVKCQVGGCFVLVWSGWEEMCLLEAVGMGWLEQGELRFLCARGGEEIGA